MRFHDLCERISLPIVPIRHETRHAFLYRATGHERLPRIAYGTTLPFLAIIGQRGGTKNTARNSQTGVIRNPPIRNKLQVIFGGMTSDLNSNRGTYRLRAFSTNGRRLGAFMLNPSCNSENFTPSTRSS